MSLQISVGHCSLTGPRERNEDYFRVMTPEDQQRATKGIMAVIADGVGGNAGGREAAEMSVRSISTDFYATPDTWQIHTSLDKVISAANRWLLAQSSAHHELSGMATTLSLAVFRGQRYYTAHVGDSRIYRLRSGTLKQLTSDHVWDRPDMRHVLKRAVGLDQHLVIDFAEGQLEKNDLFILLTDGIWGVLDAQAIQHTLSVHKTPQQIAKALANRATTEFTQDNATAVVIRIDEIGADSFSDFLAEGRHSTLPAKLGIGDTLDNFEITDILHQSRTSRLYQVKDRQNHQRWVLKTLQPVLAGDSECAQALLNEEWLSKRVVSQYFPQVLPLSSEQRSHLYYVMSWHEGATLQQRLDHGHHFTAAGLTHLATDLVRGLSVLHRLNIIHRDIKPDNIHIGTDGRLRILDLGVAISPGAPTLAGMPNPGTPSFMAPELFESGSGCVSTDLYAAGVTLYHLLTRKYPYGEIEPFQHPRFGEPVPPSRYRPEIPGWLENILLKAVAAKPEQRFETAEEMLLALERGAFRPIMAPQRAPLIERARLLKWQWFTIFSMMANFLLVYLLIIS